MEEISKTSLKMQVPQNEFRKEKFEDFNVGNQMLCTCGSNEPFNPFK